MEMEEEKEIILKNLGDCVKKVYGEWCSSPCRNVGCKNVRGVVAGVDDALGHGLRRPADGYWPLLSTLLDQDTRSHLLLYQCPKARGWQWVVRSLARGELESLVTVVLAHLHRLPPLYRPHALLLDPSAQLVLPTLLAGLEHVKLPQSTEVQLSYQPPITASASLQEQPPRESALSSFRSLRASLLSSRRSSTKLQQSSPSTTHRVQPHHHSGECTTSPPSPGRRTPIAPTAPSPQFLFNVPQGQFPSLEPQGAYSSITTSGGQMVFPQPQYATDHFTGGMEGGLDYDLDEDPPIDTCREATEELSEQVLDAEDEAEMTVQVHHFGKKKRNRNRSSASVTASSVSTPCGAVDGALKEKEDEAEAQEMSLEDELRAATHGDFMENRPPLALGTDPDLIVGIFNDDKLVKVMPDVSLRSHTLDALGVEACDEFSADDVEVEIVEVFADRLVRREDLHKLSTSNGGHAQLEQNDSHGNLVRGSLPSGVGSRDVSDPNAPPVAVARSLETTSNLIKSETLKKSSSHSTPSRTPKMESKHPSRGSANLDQALALNTLSGGGTDGGGLRQRQDSKKLEKQHSVTGSGKSKKDKREEPKARNSQQQLLEARQLLRSLTASGVIDDSPELVKLLESLEQREAMLWERSPPEGQEDPPGVQGGSSNSLKKLSRQSGSKAAKGAPQHTAATGEGEKKEKDLAGTKDALDAMENGSVLRRNTYTKTDTPKQKEVPCSNASSVSPAVYTEFGQSGSETYKSEKAIADDTAMANTRAYATSCDEQDTLASDDDEVIRHEDGAGGIEERDYDSDDIPEGSLLDVDESVAETDLNADEEEEEEESQLMTDADPSEAREVMSCSSSSSSNSEDSDATGDDGGGDTDVDQSREAIDGCYSTDDDGAVYLRPRVHGNRSAGVGLDTDDTFSSDDESSVGAGGGAAGSEDSGTEDEDCLDLGSVQQLVAASASYHRQPVAMDESMCSLDEANADEEALTEGCREKTGIMGGTKWEELMGAGANIKLGTPAKIVHLVSETNTPRICDEDPAKLEIVEPRKSVSNCSISKSISATSVTHAPVVNSLSLGANFYATNVSVPFVSSVSSSNLFSVESNIPNNIANSEPLVPLGTDNGLINNISETKSPKYSTTSNGLEANNHPVSSTLAETSEYPTKPLLEPMPHSEAFLEEAKNMTEATIANLKELEAAASDKYAPGAGMTRTLSLSSCGSKSGLFECSSRYDARSDGKLSAILDTKLDCKLDSTSESVVAALDDAAREAQLQLLHLHTQLLGYKRMAARKKARKVIDAKMNPAIKHTMLALKIPVRLTTQAFPPQLFPLKHQEVPLPGCEECEEQLKLEESYLEEFSDRMSLTVSEAAQNVLTTAIFRRPGEKLVKVFMMREGHTRGVACPVRVVLSTHALYVLNTCPAPSLLHALPYTQLHTAVLGACRDWVVVLSRGAVESGGELRGHVGGGEAAVDASTPSSTVGGEAVASPYAVGIQLCSADPDLTVEFVASLELQTRRSLMSALATEMRVAGGEGRFMPPPTLSSQYQSNDKVSDQLCKGLSRTDSLSELSTQLPPSAPSDCRSSRVSTPQEGTPSWKRVTSSAGRGLKPQHFGLSDCIEALVPSVVDASDWENKVLAQWLQHLLPPELQVCCPVLGSWLVDWDGGVRLGQSGALGPTLEGPLLFRTTKLFSSWRQAHFLLKAGVLYQFWSSGDRLPSTMLDVTRCSACTPTTQHGKQYAFQVIQSDGSPLLLAAADAEQAGRWMQALSAVLSTAVGRPSTRRPLPCRLLLLPHTLVLLHQTDLLLAAMSPASPPPPPPAPHPTPALPTHQLQAAMQCQVPLSSAPAIGPGGLIQATNTAAAGGKADDFVGGRRDSKSNLAPLLPAVGNLRNTRHLSSSLTSLNSTSSSTVTSSMISNTSVAHQAKALPGGAAAALSMSGQFSKPHQQPSVTGVSSAMTASFSGPFPSATSTPNPPRSLALTNVVGDGMGRTESGLRRPSGSGSVRLPLNTRAAARVVARLDLRQLASVGRYNECSNTVMLEVGGSSSRELGELGVAMSGPMPSTGDWALYFRGAKQLEHFLAALSVEAVVCERDLCESNVQQFLLEGAQASAGGWAAVTTYAGGA